MCSGRRRLWALILSRCRQRRQGAPVRLTHAQPSPDQLSDSKAIDVRVLFIADLFLNATVGRAVVGPSHARAQPFVAVPPVELNSEILDMLSSLLVGTTESGSMDDAQQS